MIFERTVIEEVMKSSYKLLNIYLDGQPIPTCMPCFADWDDTRAYAEVEESYTLFDIPVCRRKLSGMKLLSYRSGEEIVQVIANLPADAELAVILDYQSVSASACRLYIRRILQTIYLISKQCPHLKILLVGECAVREKLMQFYCSV